MRPSIVNVNNRDLVFSAWGDKALQAQFTTLVQPLADQKMGCRLVVVPAGNVCWPYHFQFANEEIYVVLVGEGVLSHGGRDYPLRAGDVISAPPVLGSKQQIRNTGASALRYLAVSIMDAPDRVEVDGEAEAVATPAEAAVPSPLAPFGQAQDRPLPGGEGN